MIRSFDTGQAPHFPPQTTVARVMLQVILALVPAIFMGLGVLVAVLALGVFLPLWDLSAAARG